MKLQLSYPIEPVTFTQHFGDNVQFYKDPKYGGLTGGHNGDDFLAYHGQPVYATHDGRAEFEIDSSGGHGVIITTDPIFDDELNGGLCRYKTIYWHLCDSIKEPQYRSPLEDGIRMVSNGDLIGYADNTGASTGDHLHFGLKRCDAQYNTLNTNNGFLGAIDPTPYFDGTTQSKLHTMLKLLPLYQKVVSLLQSLLPH